MICTLSVHSQSFFKSSNYQVSKNDIPIDLAWEGGLNAPQFSEIDLDNDGKKELFLFDRINNRICLLKWNGTKYTPFISNKVSFPSNLSGWVLLRDMNCDGFEDVVCSYTLGNIAVYLNKATPGITSFQENPTVLQSFFNYESGSFTTGIYVGSSDLPSIEDLDHDGDFDILTFAFAGTTIEYYRNMSVENSGNCGMEYELKNGCWAYLEEGFSTNEIILGRKACDNQVKNPNKSSRKHSGSSLLSIDLDGDDIYDLLLGDISFQNVVGISVKHSSLGGDSAVAQNVTYPSESEKIDIPIFPATAYLDLNGDQTKDLVSFPNNPNGVDNHTGIWLYTNAGSDDIPTFQLNKKGFLQDQMIDIGENNSAIFSDLNADSKLDLVMGSRGYSNGNGTYTSSLHYYQNVGTQTTPSFKWISNDLGNSSQFGLGTALDRKAHV